MESMLNGGVSSGWVRDACHDRVKVGMVFVGDYRGAKDQRYEVIGDNGTGLFEVRRPDGDVGLMRPSTILNALVPLEEWARDVLRAGKRIRVVVGPRELDPKAELYLHDGMVMFEATGGWSAGVVEPMCGIDRPYLAERLAEYESVEIID